MILNDYLGGTSTLELSHFFGFNVSLAGQEETISTSAAPTNTSTSHISLIFFLTIAIFSSICPKSKCFKFTVKFFPFLLFFYFFSCSPSHKSQNKALKYCSKSNFFSIKTIRMANCISNAELCLNFSYFALNKLNLKRINSSKFYKFLILLSGDVSLNPGPCQGIDQNDKKFEPFRNRGLHFLHVNVNSLLSKIDELRDIVGFTKPAILGITETKLDNTVPDQEIKISGYNVLRSDRNRNGGGVACYIRADLCFNNKNVFSNSIEHVFFDLLIPKVKPISIGIFYRPPNANNFLETFISDLKHINFEKNEIYFLGDFNINLLSNNKFALKENQ